MAQHVNVMCHSQSIQTFNNVESIVCYTFLGTSCSYKSQMGGRLESVKNYAMQHLREMLNTEIKKTK